MVQENKYRIVSVAVVAFLFALTLLWLCLTHLHYTPADGSEWPPPDDTTALLLADDYIEVEPVFPLEPGGGSDEGAASTSPEAHDIIDAGMPAESPAPLVTSEQSSPVTAPPAVPVNSIGPETSENIQAKPKEAPKPDIQNDPKNRWNRGLQKGTDGSDDSNTGPGADTGAGTGSHRGTGNGNFGGRTVKVDDSGIYASSPGRLVVQIYVDPQGKVLLAEPWKPRVINNGGYDEDVQNQCLRRAEKAVVEKKADAPARQKGEITFTFN